MARIKGDWAADVKAFDDIYTEILVLADALCDGIVAQFPDRFARVPVTAVTPSQRQRPRRKSRSCRSGQRDRPSRGCWAPMATDTASRPSPIVGSSSLIFASNRCPTVKAYAERMKGVAGGLRSPGRAAGRDQLEQPHLYPDESYRCMVERAGEDGYAFPYLVDEDEQRIGRAYGAKCTFHLLSSTAIAGSATRVASTTRGSRETSRATICTMRWMTSSQAARFGHPTTRPWLQPGLRVRSSVMHAATISMPGRMRIVLAAIAGAWLASAIAQWTGEAALLHHHALIEDGPPALDGCAAVPGWVAGHDRGDDAARQPAQPSGSWMRRSAIEGHSSMAC